MSILVGIVNNKFWNNSDYKFPNSFPTYDKETLLEKNRPNLVDFMSGTIYLYGDEWNHCLYEGVYYHLEIARIIDVRKKYCLYNLIRDLWFDVLKERPRVIGDLSNSNDDELLGRHLNRTIPVIDNPARVVTINFGDIDFDGRKGFTFEESNKDLLQVVLPKREYDKFVQASHSPFAKKWKKIDKQYYSGSKNPAVYILATLEKAQIKSGWKHLLRTKINEFVRGIPGEAGKELKIGKVTVQNAAGNKLQGNYCITAKVEGIAQGEENLRLKKIDLSNLEDIIPINFHDLREIEPYVSLLDGEKNGLFDLVDTPEKFKYPFLAKVRSKIRTPIGASPSKHPVREVKSWYGFSFNPPDCNGRGFEPQEITGDVEGKKGKGFLGWVDNLNFTLEYDNHGYSHSGRARRAGQDDAEIAGFSHTYLYNRGEIGEDEKEKFRWMVTAHPRPGAARDLDPFPDVTGTLVPFGFQIFGLERQFQDGKVIKYLADSPTKSVNYFSGVKKKFFERYSGAEQAGWSTLTSGIRKINPSDELIRFYLENFYFSWTAFFPGDYSIFWMDRSPGYETVYRTDIGGTYKYTNNNWRFPYIITSDIYDPRTEKWVEANPFNEADGRYQDYRRKTDRKLRDVLSLGRIELPKDVLLEKGDYFINWQEHDISRFPIVESENFKLTFPGPYGHFDSGTAYGAAGQGHYLHNYGLRLDDVVEVPGSEYVFDTPDEKSVVLCTTYEGDIEIRISHTFERMLYLDPEQVIETVDGASSVKGLFTIIKKELGGLTGADGNYGGIQDIHKADLLYAFYKSQGYKVKVNAGVAHGNWFNERDFSEENDQHLLFDLVGTEGYCHIRKGKISLIAKNKSLFQSQEAKVKSLLHAQNPDLKPSLVEKINQKVRLQFLNVPYYLNGRSSFTDEDKIFLSLTTLEPTDATTSFDQYFIKVDTQFDSVYYENIAIPKQLNKSIDLTSTLSIEKEKLYLDLARDKYAWQIDQDRLKIATDRYEEAIKRSQNELEIQRIEAFANLGTSVATAGAGSAISFAFAGEKTVTRTKRAWERQKGSRSKPFLKVFNTTTTTTPSRYPNVGAALFSTAANLAKGQALTHALRFPEQQRRIDVDKEIGAAELANQSLQINTAHMDRQIKAQLALNQISNIYNNPVINERAILEEFRKKKEWHDNKELNIAYLTVFLPSEEQLIALRSFKEEYGVMCDIPDVITNYYDGMKPDFIRYRNLDDAAIKNIENQIVRDFFKGHLLAGIKIIQTSTESYRLLTVYEYKDQILRLNSDLFQQQAVLDAKNAQVLLLTNKVTSIAEDTRKEWQNEKTNLEQQIQNIENQLNNVNTELRKKIEELNKFKEQCASEKDALETQREEGRETETRLNDAIRRVEAQKTALEDSLRKVADERDAAKIVINNLNKEKENLENQKADIERQLQECLNKPKDDKEAQKTINTLRGQIQELNNKLAAKEVQGHRRVQCADLKQMIGDGYIVDIQVDGAGGSKAEDLINAIVESVDGIDKGDVDQALQKYRPLRRFFNLGEEFKNYPLVDQFYEVSKGRQTIQRARLLLTNPNLAGLKAALDVLNYEAWKAFNELQEEINKNTILEQFFSHLYPGRQIKELYETVFQTDTEKAIARQKFMETKCVQDGTDSYEYLQDLMRTVSFDISHLAVTGMRPPTFIEMNGQPIKEHIIEPWLGYGYNAADRLPGDITTVKELGRYQAQIYNYPYNYNAQKWVYVYFQKAKNVSGTTKGYYFTFVNPTLPEGKQFSAVFMEERIKEVFRGTQEVDINSLKLKEYTYIRVYDHDVIFRESGGSSESFDVSQLKGNRLKARFLGALFSYWFIGLYIEEYNAFPGLDYKHITVNSSVGFPESVIKERFTSGINSRGNISLGIHFSNFGDLVAGAYKTAVAKEGEWYNVFVDNPFVSFAVEVRRLLNL